MLCRQRPRAGDPRRRRQLPRLRRCFRRPRDGAALSPSTPRPALASATPRRPCWCTGRCAATSSRASLAELARPVSSCAATSACWPLAAMAADSLRHATEEDFGTSSSALTHGDQGGRHSGRGDRPHQPLRHRPLGGHRHRATSPLRGASRTGWTPPAVYVNASTRFTDGASSGSAPRSSTRPRSHARGPVGLRELYDLQVRGPRHRPGTRGATLQGSDRCESGSSAGCSTRPTSATWCAPRRRTRQLGLDRVVLMPLGRAPHREIERIRAPEVRHALCEAAAGVDDRLEASRIGSTGRGPLHGGHAAELAGSRPDDELVLLLGGDEAADLPSWHRPDEVLAVAEVGVVGRSGSTPDDVRARVSGLSGAEGLRFFEMPRIDISSSLVRRRVARGASDPVPRPAAGRAVDLPAGPRPARRGPPRERPGSRAGSPRGRGLARVPEPARGHRPG